MRGVSRIEIVVVLGCALLLGVAAWVLLSQKKTIAGDIRDARQLRNIHTSLVTFSHEFGGVFPTPGLINRLPFDGQEVPGRGPEDVSANTTANLYSVCIMNNYFTPEVCVSPTERNPNVTVKGDDYNYQVYSVQNAIHWDSNFKADLVTGSNVSYAHMPIVGTRKVMEWKDTSNSEWPVLGNRGPKDGKLDQRSYTLSQHGTWWGYIICNDNSSRHYRVGTDDKTYQALIEDLFSTDEANGGDAILTFTKEVSEKDAVFQFD